MKGSVGIERRYSVVGDVCSVRFVLFSTENQQGAKPRKKAKWRKLKSSFENRYILKGRGLDEFESD